MFSLLSVLKSTSPSVPHGVTVHICRSTDKGAVMLRVCWYGANLKVMPSSYGILLRTWQTQDVHRSEIIYLGFLHLCCYEKSKSVSIQETPQSDHNFMYLQPLIFSSILLAYLLGCCLQNRTRLNRRLLGPSMASLYFLSPMTFNSINTLANEPALFFSLSSCHP